MSRNDACPKSTIVIILSGEAVRFCMFLKTYWVEILIVVGLDPRLSSCCSSK